jgi:hypothetical protein
MRSRVSMIPLLLLLCAWHAGGREHGAGSPTAADSVAFRDSHDDYFSVGLPRGAAAGVMWPIWGRSDVGLEAGWTKEKDFWAACVVAVWNIHIRPHSFVDPYVQFTAGAGVGETWPAMEMRWKDRRGFIGGVGLGVRVGPASIMLRGATFPWWVLSYHF